MNWLVNPILIEWNSSVSLNPYQTPYSCTLLRSTVKNLTTLSYQSLIYYPVKLNQFLVFNRSFIARHTVTFSNTFYFILFYFIVALYLYSIQFKILFLHTLYRIIYIYLPGAFIVSFHTFDD